MSDPPEMQVTKNATPEQDKLLKDLCEKTGSEMVGIVLVRQKGTVIVWQTLTSGAKAKSREIVQALADGLQHGANTVNEQIGGQP